MANKGYIVRMFDKRNYGFSKREPAMDDLWQMSTNCLTKNAFQKQISVQLFSLAKFLNTSSPVVEFFDFATRYLPRISAVQPWSRLMQTYAGI